MVKRRIVIAFAAMVALFVAILVGFSLILLNERDLGKQNKERIQDIQQSRIDSCVKTYRSIHEVFLPFFPPPPRTKKQQANLDKFNTKITTLMQGCMAQTNPKKPKKPKKSYRIVY